jgi:hypothetical protein
MPRKSKRLARLVIELDESGNYTVEGSAMLLLAFAPNLDLLARWSLDLQQQRHPAPRERSSKASL